MTAKRCSLRWVAPCALLAILVSVEAAEAQRTKDTLTKNVPTENVTLNGESTDDKHKGEIVVESFAALRQRGSQIAWGLASTDLGVVAASQTQWAQFLADLDAWAALNDVETETRVLRADTRSPLGGKDIRKPEEIKVCPAEIVLEDGYCVLTGTEEVGGKLKCVYKCYKDPQ